MYASPDAVPRYVAVQRMMQELIPKESLRMDEIKGVPESMADAIQFKLIGAPLTEQQVKELRAKPPLRMDV
jgi:hypothetical protein